ncbi:MAG: hypothetical protein C4325_06120 [Blastocatellia bacterium]
MLIFLLPFIAASCTSAPPVAVGNRPISINDRPVKGVQPQPLKPVAEMSWTTIDGQVQKIKDFRGKILILDFWATYCKPCIEEIPHLMELQKRYPGRIEVIGLHVGGEEDRPRVPDFVQRLNITYPLATPEDALTTYVFGDDTQIPQTAIFDRDGRTVKKIVGFDDAIRDELDRAIADLIEKR